MQKSETVTLEQQKKHLEKLSNLVDRIQEYREYDKLGYCNFEAINFSYEDMDVILRALICHMAVIKP